MKYILVVCVLILTGCGYDLSEINAAKAACAKVNGQFSTSEWAEGSIRSTYCTIDGVRYRIGRSEYGFHEGIVK